MSLAKVIAARMVGAKKPVKSESAVAPARSQVHRGAPLPRAITVPREPDIAAQLSALPLPPPTPEVPAVVISKGWVGSCKAIDADTGRRCRLPAHPGESDHHRHERGPFFRTANPNQSFTSRGLLEREATRRFVTETQ